MATSRESRVIGSFQVELHQIEERLQEALGLAQRKMEDEPKGDMLGSSGMRAETIDWPRPEPQAFMHQRRASLPPRPLQD